MYDVVVEKFTFAISSPDEFLVTKEEGFNLSFATGIGMIERGPLSVSKEKLVCVILV